MCRHSERARRPSAISSWDFVAARTEDGQALRILNVVNESTRPRGSPRHPRHQRRGLRRLHQKAQLESALHDDVYAGRLTLPAAQRKIATNWVRAYHDRFGP